MHDETRPVTMTVTVLPVYLNHGPPPPTYSSSVIIVSSMMFYVVTLSLRTISVTAGGSYSATTSQVVFSAVAQTGRDLFHHKINHTLIYSLLLGLSLPMPDHITFPNRSDALPSRIFLFYFDDVQCRAVVKIKAIDDTFSINGQYRRIIADVARTTETELKAFVQAGGLIKNVAKLRKDDLLAMLILGDYRKAASERTRIQALHARLEEKTERLQEEAGERKFLELKLAQANAKVKRLAAKVKDQSRDSTGQKGSDGQKHRYPTRYSLTSSVVGTDEDA